MSPDINRLLRARPRTTLRGAPMGYFNHRADVPGKLYCQRVRFVDGDYGPDGTYWGSGGGPLYAIFSADLETLCYYRATTRMEAVRAYAEDYAE